MYKIVFKALTHLNLFAALFINLFLHSHLFYVGVLARSCYGVNCLTPIGCILLVYSKSVLLALTSM